MLSIYTLLLLYIDLFDVVLLFVLPFINCLLACLLCAYIYIYIIFILLGVLKKIKKKKKKRRRKTESENKNTQKIMRRCQWLHAFHNNRDTFLLRRANGFVTAVALQSFQVPRGVAKRRCGFAQEQKSHQTLNDDNRTASSSLSSSSLDEGGLVENIFDVLHSQLSTGKVTSLADKFDSMIDVHTLFCVLGSSLRLQLQNFLFGELVNVLKSKPDWFILSADDSRVGLTRLAWSLRLNATSKTDLSFNSASRPNLVKEETRLRKCAIKTSRSDVLVRGVYSSTPLDVSKPPLTAAEVEKWKLTRLLLPLGLPFLLDREPRSFYPHGPKPRQLSCELAEVEAMYFSKGYFPPSEVAAAFIHITPTFFVETRYVLGAMSPDIAQCFEQHILRERVVDGFFKKYPMIFKLKTGKFQKASVKLNLDFDFIRNYPGCGRADRLLRRYNREHRATVGGVISPLLVPSSSSFLGEADGCKTRVESNIDQKIFEILIGNLPRVPTEATLSKEELETMRCKPFALVEWIESFSREDLDVLNTAPQQRVLTILTRYSHIFQLMCHGEDANLFTEHLYLERRGYSKTVRRVSGESGHVNNGNSSNNAAFLDSSVSHEFCDSFLEKDMSGYGAKEKIEDNCEKNSTQLISDVKKREAVLAAALRDDMINVDEILCCDSENDTTTTLGSNEKNMTGFSADLDMHNDNEHSKEWNYQNNFFNFGKDSEKEKAGEDGERKNGSDIAISDAAFKKDAPCETDQICDDDDWEDSYIPSRYDIIYVRRLPKNIAPRSLSDYNANNSPEPELVQHIASFLNPPPSMRNGRSGTQFGGGSQLALCFAKRSASGHWRWVPIQRIYASLSVKQKRLLRPYKGLVHFIRLHGEVFEISTDFLNVIAHDPEGQVAPYFPTQTMFYSEDRILLSPTFDDDEKSKASLIGDAERDKFRSILGASQVPTDRRQLLLLDPFNPLLDHDVLCEEVSFFMPDHPVSLHQLMARLPPILRAALSIHHKNNFKTSKHLTVWTENNRMMLQKSKLAVPVSATACENKLTVEDAVECIREIVPDEGVVIGHLNRMLPGEAKNTLKEHFGNLYNALLGYPQFFYIEKREGSRSVSTVFLVERLQEKE